MKSIFLMVFFCASLGFAEEQKAGQFVNDYLVELTKSFEVQDNRKVQYQIIDQYLHSRFSANQMLPKIFSAFKGGDTPATADDIAITKAVLRENVRQKMAGFLSSARSTELARLNSGFAKFYADINEEFAKTRSDLINKPLTFKIKSEKVTNNPNVTVVVVELIPELDLDIFFNIYVHRAPGTGQLKIVDYQFEGVKVYRLIVNELKGHINYYYKRDGQLSSIAWFHQTDNINNVLERWGVNRDHLIELSGDFKQ